jgi:hypothetical protein
MNDNRVHSVTQGGPWLCRSSSACQWQEMFSHSGGGGAAAAAAAAAAAKSLTFVPFSTLMFPLLLEPLKSTCKHIYTPFQRHVSQNCMRWANLCAKLRCAGTCIDLYIASLNNENVRFAKKSMAVSDKCR